MELTPQQREQLGKAALDWALQYFNQATEPPIYPVAGPDDIRKVVSEPLPESSQPIADVMAQFAAIAKLGRKNDHPRMFGYVQSSASFAGAAADFLASALNQNVTSWRSAPSATTVEHQVIEWIKTFVGFPSTAAGVLLGGGSAANFAGLAAALRAGTTADLNENGVSALPGKPRIFASSAVHMSIPKAAAMLGIGRAAVQTVTNLDEAIRTARANGEHVVCVVANAGEVNTGAIDPLNEIADVCQRHRVWLHVDGSYGGFAAGVPSLGNALAGLERADSVSLDPHKWMFAPLDAGCLLVKDGYFLHRAFSQGASYIDVVADDKMSEYVFWDHSPELSRRFRALKIWFILKCYGAAALREAIDGNIRVARELGAVIQASHDFELLAPVTMSIVCFRYVKGGGDLNELNRRLMLDLQRGGESYVSNTMIGDKFALRACITNFRTTSADVAKLLHDIRVITF